MKKLITLLLVLVTLNGYSQSDGNKRMVVHHRDSIPFYFKQYLDEYRRTLYPRIPDVIISDTLSYASKHHNKYLANMMLEDGSGVILMHDEPIFLNDKIIGYSTSSNYSFNYKKNIDGEFSIYSRFTWHSINKKNETEKNRSVKPVTYSVVKSGLIGLTRYLSTYWADKGVRCNVMCPGGIENGQSDEFLDKVKTRIPMGRLAKSDEYQGTLIWMLSNASSYLNGAVVPVDGGRTVW